MLWVPLITGLAVILVIVQTQLRAVNQSWAVLTSTTFTVVVALLLIPQLNQIVGFLQSLSAQAGVSAHYLAPILKTTAIVYVTSFGTEICRDADENAMAVVVELAGKLIILIIALPLIEAILTAVLGILG
ncbi:MAG: stage III sporulation protein AD [Firmicutes bacterium]|jgi:stage III sporulation protein AD|nr:stage III sporulation protein AD [Bacillota bacterium]